MNEAEAVRWLQGLGVDLDNALRIAADGTDAERLSALPAKRCYNSFVPGLNKNVTKTRSDMSEYLENLLKSRHGSTLEHASWTWAIEGCTRVFTAEANRHRAGAAISEASLRYIRFDGEIQYWEPHSIDEEGDKYTRTRALFKKAFAQDSENYRELESIWKEELEGDFTRKKELTSMFRRIIGLGVSVGAVYTWNCRAMRHILELRCSPAAEEEIRYVMHMVLSRLKYEEPRLFGDFDEHGKPRHSKV